MEEKEIKINKSKKNLVNKIWNPIDKLMQKLPYKKAKYAPNIITFIRLLSAVGLVVTIAVSGVASAFGYALWMGLTAGTDFIDGKVARRYNLTSKFGAQLDASVDKVLLVGTNIALITSGVLSPWFLSLFLRDIYVTTFTAIHKNHTAKKLSSKASFVDNVNNGFVIPPNIFGKWKFGLHAAGLALAIICSNNASLSIIPNIVLFSSIAICIPDVIKFTKEYNKREYNLKNNIKNDIIYEEDKEYKLIKKYTNNSNHVLDYSKCNYTTSSKTYTRVRKR